MEKSQKKNRKGLRNGITIHINNLVIPENITTLDLGHRNIDKLDDSLKLPANLVCLDLSHNNLYDIPNAVLQLESLKTLDVSFNKIKCFNDFPKFCHAMELLNISHNDLAAPPHWIWFQTPSKLTELDLSGNTQIIKSLEEDDLLKLLQCKTLITHIKMYNCRMRLSTELLKTFPKAKVLELGSTNFSYFASNHIEQVPCRGMVECCDIERLNLSNTHLYCINSNIDMYKNLIEINMSENNIDSIPNEFCNLDKLEICVLSHNNVFNLPEDMVKLKKLTCLLLDNNKLYMLPDSLCDLPRLKILDLYFNNLHELPENIKKISELDLALNYFEEPDDAEYLEKKEKLRLNIPNRCDGRKPDIISRPESERSANTTDDEELINNLDNCSQEQPRSNNTPPSSPEDWDSDEHWIPRHYRYQIPSPQTAWHYFTKQKIDEGNFCPVDMHSIPVQDKVKYEKLCHPPVYSYVDGQFDDCSEDDS